MGLLQRLGLWVLHARFPLVPGVVGMALACSALFGGVQADDLYIRSVVLQSDLFDPVRPSRWEPYTYLDGDRDRTREIVERGWMPWWTDPDCNASFWRPLTALSFMADFHLWPGQAWLMHLQSIAWYGLVVGAVGLLYRRLMLPSVAGWVVGVASIMYAVDEAHAIPAGWLANRNALMAVFFGVVALLVYDHGCRKSKKSLFVVAAIALAASLLSKEEGVSTLGYLCAYALFLDRRSVRARLKSLAPCLLIAIVWFLCYKALGYGVFSSEVYVDPGSDPVRFLGRVARNGPILLLAAAGSPPSDASLFVSSSLFAAYWLVAIVFLVMVAIVAGRFVRQNALARFWLAGTLASLLPVCAVFSSDRLLMFPGIGVMGFLAHWLAWRCENGGAKVHTWRRRLERVLASLLVFVHLILAPLMFPVSAIAMRFVGQALTDFYESIPDDLQLADQNLVFVNSLLTIGDMVWIQGRHAEKRPFPLSVLHLSPSGASVRITRPDERTLIVAPKGGYLQPRGFVPQGAPAPMVSLRYHAQLMDMVVRAEGRRMELHDTTHLSFVDIEVTAMTPDGRPAEATFRFRSRLEDASLRWLYIEDHRFKEFDVPAIGDIVEVGSAL